MNDVTPRTSTSVSGAPSAFVGGGEMGDRIRAHDWRTSPLGSPLGSVEAWPQSLRIMVSVILGSSHPMFVMWGQSLTMLYNDSCRSILGSQHPSALGKAGADVWADAWDTLGPMAQQVMTTGTAAGTNNLQRFVQRESALVESYYSFCYSPVRDDAGHISGIFCSCSDTTQQVVGDRRLRTLRSLDGILSPIEALPEAARMAIETLASNPQDIPFALLYLVDGNQLARLTSFTGIEPDTAASPLIIDLTQNDETAWPFNQAYHRAEKIVVTNLAERFEDLPTGMAQQPLSTAVIRPLVQPDAEQVIGLLVMAVSPTQPFEEDYQGFFDLVTTHVEKAIINAKIYAAERDRMTALVSNDLALREKQQQLDLALKSGRIGTWQLEANTLAFSASDQCKINYGLPVETDFTYSLLMSRIHPDDRAWVEAHLEETLQEVCGGQDACPDRTQYDVEYRTKWDDGSTHWIVSRAYLACDDAGRPQRVIGITIDITERKQTEEAIKESEWQFRRVVESNMFGVVFGNIRGQLHYVNDYFAQLLGYGNAQIISDGLTWQQITPPDNTAPNPRVLEQLKTEGICAPYEKVLQHADGRRIPTLMAAAMLEEPYDQAEESIGIFLDLTSLKQVTEDRDRFFNLSPDIFSIANAEGYFTYASRAWEKILGFTPAEITAQPYLDFVHPDDIESALEVAQQLSQGHSLIEYENRYRHKDGSYRWISWNVIATQQNTQFYCVGRDVSEQKLRESEREQLLNQEQAAREAAERANRIKDEFLAVVSHELRSPLNPILGWSQLLKRGTLTPEKTAYALETIERNAQLQVQLIGDLLDISRILRGKLSLEKKSVDLEAVIAAAVETVRLAAEAKSIQVTLVSQACTVRGDAGRLQQVIWNLLSNAVKFTPENGEVRITTAINGSQAQIKVTDTGKGISAEFLPYVFEHFRQEDYSTTRQFGGLGLGLAITRQIVDLHGGTVQVESPGENQGATFRVSIPLAVGAAVKEADSLANAETHLNGLHVLTVDDDADSQEITVFALEQAGARVSAFTSGVDVLAFLQEISGDLPHVIISDIGMPDMDGYSLMRKIRQLSVAQGSQIVAIALTAYAGELDQQQALAAGFHCHATKPIDPSSLISLIAEQLNKVSNPPSRSAAASA